MLAANWPPIKPSSHESGRGSSLNLSSGPLRHHRGRATRRHGAPWILKKSWPNTNPDLDHPLPRQRELLPYVRGSRRRSGAFIKMLVVHKSLPLIAELNGEMLSPTISTVVTGRFWRASPSR
jgi:hypothetical protein